MNVRKNRKPILCPLCNQPMGTAWCNTENGRKFALLKCRACEKEMEKL